MVLVVLAEAAGEEDVVYTIRDAGVIAGLVIVDVAYVSVEVAYDDSGSAEVDDIVDEAVVDEMATQNSS
jgi:hypothetical protein